jgi:hypothetical protein
MSSKRKEHVNEKSMCKFLTTFLIIVLLANPLFALAQTAPQSSVPPLTVTIKIVTDPISAFPYRQWAEKN